MKSRSVDTHKMVSVGVRQRRCVGRRRRPPTKICKTAAGVFELKHAAASEGSGGNTAPGGINTDPEHASGEGKK